MVWWCVIHESENKIKVSISWRGERPCKIKARNPKTFEDEALDLPIWRPEASKSIPECSKTSKASEIVPGTFQNRGPRPPKSIPEAPKMPFSKDIQLKIINQLLFKNFWGL